MSHHICLITPHGEIAQVDRHVEGGTYVRGGTSDAEMTVTYNYSPMYYAHLDSELGLRWLDGKLAKATIQRMQTAVSVLGASQDKDYWAATPGNAGYALLILIDWAYAHPKAHWVLS